MDTPRLTGSIKGGDQLIQRLRSLEDNIRAELRITVDKLGTSLLELVKRTAAQKLNKAPTGALVGAINKVTRESGTSITSTVGISLRVIPYARIHEYGGVTRPHDIYPRKKLALAIPGLGVFKHVHHPGSHIPERSYMRSSLKQLAPTVEEQIKKALTRAANHAGFKK